MVTSNNYGQYGSLLLSGVISSRFTNVLVTQTFSQGRGRAHLLVELSEFLVFIWYRHTLQILPVSYGLKVAADEQNVDLVAVLRL